MALIKTYTRESDGATGNYWKILSYVIDGWTKKAKVTVALYVSQEIREQDKQPMLTQSFTIPLASVSDDCRPTLYNALKTFKRSGEEVALLDGATDLI